jgi:outer membrane protein TolC
MSRSAQVGWLFAAITMIVTPASAQEPLTLRSAVDLALRQNPALQGVQEEAKAAQARVGEARANWFPNINFSQSFTRGNNPVYVFGTLLTQRRFSAANFALPGLNAPTPLNNFQTRLEGQVSLFDSRRVHFRVQQVRQFRSATDSQTEQARQDLILRVVEEYYGIIVARENLLAATEAARSAESNALRAENMQRAGLLVDSDLLSARVFLAQMKDRAISAQNGLESAQMALAREMGLGMDARPEPSETLSGPVPIGETAQEWIRLALERRPAMHAVQAQAEASASQAGGARAEFGPRVGLYANVERDALVLTGPAGTNWTAAARIDFNLFAGGAQRARLAEARANQRKAGHDVEWLRSGIELEVRRSYLEASAAAQRADTARDAVEQARASLRIIQNRYEVGLTDVTELLRAQTAQLETRTGYLSALHTWQVARARLEHAAGVLTTDSVILKGPNAP